jgi:hypothetical protein
VILATPSAMNRRSKQIPIRPSVMKKRRSQWRSHAMTTLECRPRREEREEEGEDDDDQDDL